MQSVVPTVDEIRVSQKLLANAPSQQRAHGYHDHTDTGLAHESKRLSWGKAHDRLSSINGALCAAEARTN